MVHSIRTKPGMAHVGATDVASILLAEHMEVGESDDVLVLNCGAGEAGLAAARIAESGRVRMADAGILAVRAARDNIRENAVANAEVFHSCGAGQLPSAGPVDVAAVRSPKGKRVAIQCIWDAYRSLKTGGRLYLAGAGKEGVKTHLGLMEALFGNMQVLAYRKGARVGVSLKTGEAGDPPKVFADPLLDHGTFHAFSATLLGKSYAIRSRPGVFAWNRLDEGARTLVENMKVRPGETVLELGCGCGIVGVVASDLSGEGEVVMVDADIEAVRAAEETVRANGARNCRVLASDCAQAVAGRAFDVVLANPPFHQGKAAAYDVARQFIRDARQVLAPGGRLYLVANRFLPYEKDIRARFGDVEIPRRDKRYKVLAARAPLAPPRRGKNS